MADAQVSVDIVAKIEGLTSGLSQASAAMQAAATAMVASMKETTEVAKESEGILKEILSGEQFIVFREKAEMALEAVRGAFEKTVATSEEFGLNNAKFASQMGTTETEAAGLAAALHGVGSSSEEYSAMALKLEMRLHTNEAAFTALGMKTRDSSGNLLSGKQLMDSAMSTLSQYKEGTDRNTVSLDLFGRSAAKMYDIARAGDEQRESAIGIYKDFGVQLEGNAEASRELEDKLNDLHTMAEAAKVAIGQKLTPAFTAMSKELRDDAKPIVDLVSGAIKGMVAVAVGAAAELKALGAIVYGAFAVMKDSVDWVNNQGAEDGRSIGQRIADDWNAATEAAKEAMDAGHAAVDAMYDDSGGKVREPTDIKYGPEGTKRAPAKYKAGGADKGQEEEISAEEKLQLAIIAIDQATNAHRLSMGKETTDEFVRQAIDLENQTYSAKLEGLNKELTVSGKTKQDKQKTLDDIVQLQVEHEGKLTAIDQQGEASRAAVTRKAVSDFVTESDEQVKAYEKGLDLQEQNGTISAAKKYQLEEQFSQKVEAEQLKRLNTEIASLTKGTEAYDAAVKLKTKIEEKGDAEHSARLKQLFASDKADVEKFAGPMFSSFNSAINGMITGTEKFSDAMKKMGQSILTNLLSVFEKMAEDWAIKHVAMALVASTTQAASATAQVSSLAATAGAGAFSSQAAIPVVGPLLGAGAATAAVASVLALGSHIASAAGGMLLDRDQLVFAHKNEQILPAHLSQGIQNMVSSGSSGGGGDTHLHYSPTVYGQKTQSLADLLHTQGRDMHGWLAEQSRNGSLRKTL